MHWDFPYPSQRMPLLARNVVATSQPLAAQAGIEMLKKGGNAVDAALATAITLTVVEPNMNGIGADAFAIIWDGKTLHGLNASGRAPKAWNLQRFAGRDAMPTTGWDCVTVPGAVSAWIALSQRFGKLPFMDLFVPAILYADKGFAVSPITAKNWATQAEKYRQSPDFASAFLPNGRAPQPGEMFRFPEQAYSLSMIGASKGEAFYRGELAKKIVAHSQTQGGAMTLDDLAAHQVDWDATISQDYRGVTLHEIPPNGQGIAALMALGILEKFDLAGMAVDGADVQHLQIEAMKLAFADVYKFVAERKAMEVTTEQMLDDSYLASRARLIDMKKAQDFQAGNPVKGGTIYLTAADENGMMVSFIQSNYMGFGSGCVEPTFGISLQNRGHGFSLEPGPNQVAPGKRPFQTIIPAFLTKGGQPVMSFGVMGGNMQPQGHMQTLVRMIDYHQSPQTACDAPRWRFNQGLELNVEQAMDKATVQDLTARGHRLEVIRDSYQDFGAGQFIWRAGNPKVEGYVAASDARRDGLAAGF